jgi:hypothetical protein
MKAGLIWTDVASGNASERVTNTGKTQWARVPSL